MEPVERREDGADQATRDLLNLKELTMISIQHLPWLGVAAAAVFACASDARAQVMTMNSATVNADPGATVNCDFQEQGQGRKVRFVLRADNGALLGTSAWANIENGNNQSFSVLFTNANGAAVQPKVGQKIHMEHSNGGASNPEYVVAG